MLPCVHFVVVLQRRVLYNHICLHVPRSLLAATASGENWGMGGGGEWSGMRTRGWRGEWGRHLPNLPLPNGQRKREIWVSVRKSELITLFVLFLSHVASLRWKQLGFSCSLTLANKSTQGSCEKYREESTRPESPPSPLSYLGEKLWQDPNFQAKEIPRPKRGKAMYL